MGRVDQIFIHQMDETHILILLTPVDVLDEVDEILGLHKVVHLNEKPIIVGINAIHAEKLYVVQVDRDGIRVWVEWQVEWL